MKKSYRLAFKLMTVSLGLAVIFPLLDTTFNNKVFTILMYLFSMSMIFFLMVYGDLRK